VNGDASCPCEARLALVERMQGSTVYCRSSNDQKTPSEHASDDVIDDVSNRSRRIERDSAAPTPLVADHGVVAKNPCRLGWILAEGVAGSGAKAFQERLPVESQDVHDIEQAPELNRVRGDTADENVFGAREELVQRVDTSVPSERAKSIG
jgi:hypothetical protein